MKGILIWESLLTLLLFHINLCILQYVLKIPRREIINLDHVNISCSDLTNNFPKSLS